MVFPLFLFPLMVFPMAIPIIWDPESFFLCVSFGILTDGVTPLTVAEVEIMRNPFF